MILLGHAISSIVDESDEFRRLHPRSIAMKRLFLLVALLVAAPAHAASVAGAVVEAGAHAGACSRLARLLATCTFEGSMHATAPVPAALAADAAGEDGAQAGASSWPLRQE